MTNLIVAAVPQYGVKLEDAGSTIMLIADDSGGRGWPYGHGLLPVTMASGRAQVIIGGSAKAPPYSEAELFVAFQRVERKGDVPPYRLTLPSTDWPSAGTYVLLLFLFWQSKGVDGLTENWGPIKLNTVDQAIYRKEATKAINAYLAAASLSELNPGLIRQTLSSTPNPTNGPHRIPAPEPQTVTFALASCLYPSDILDQMPANQNATRGPADASLLALADRLQQDDPPTLILLAGDQVYVDATAGMFDPKALDAKYRVPYQRRGQSRGVQAVAQEMGRNPTHQVLDDHEISDNWAQGELTPAGQVSALELGRDAYWLHQRPSRLTGNAAKQLWRNDVAHKGLPFFLADVRSEREMRTALNGSTRRIMESNQFDAIKAWLKAQDATKAKFIATSSALLPRHLAVAHDPKTALHSDAWDAYPQSLHELLAFVCDAQIKGLVFLSGDQHISNVVEAKVEKLKGEEVERTCCFHSVHSSALYAPYPFANAIPEDFARVETFEFSVDNRRYRCKVDSKFAPPGDGFAVLTVKPTSGGADWRMAVEFHSANGIKVGSKSEYLLL